MTDTPNLQRPGPPRLDDIIAVCFYGWVIFVVLHLLKGRLFHAGIDTVNMTATGILWYLARQDTGRHQALLGHLNLLVSLVGLVLVALFSGQGQAMAGWYLAILPLIAVYQSGARSALAWTIVGLGCLTLVHLSTTYYPIAPEYIAAGSEVLFGQIFMMGALSLFAIASRRENSRYIHTLEDYERALIEKADALAAHAEDLQAARDEALTALRVKGEFLANMSHEVRTPLNGVLGMTRVLLNTPLTADQRKMLVSIDTSGQALMSVINDVLDFSKIEAGEMQVERTPFALRDCIEDVLELFSRTAFEKGIDLAYLPHEDVPNRVVGDMHRIRQVLLNLVNNAVKFTPANTNGSVIVQTARHGENIEIHVVDTGIGISAEDQVRLFESFVQVDSSMARRFGGTGLGLSISRGLVENMGGRMAVHSEVGVGSTFTVTLPLPEAPALLQTMDLEEAIALIDRSLLIIGEDSPSRRALAAVADAWAMNVDASVDTDALEEILDVSPPDLVVVWDSQPAQDAYQRLQRACTAMPVLLCTSLVDVDAEVRGFDGVIHRPLRLRHVLTALLTALDLDHDTNEGASVSKQLPLNVLVVEDNAVNQQVVVNMLQRLGYSPTVASNGREAVDHVKNTKVDFVFMDMHMPDMDGLEATRQIRGLHDGQGPWIAALTASVAEDQRNACIEAGMNDFVPKPFRFDTLVAAIERAGEQRGWLTATNGDSGVESLRELYRGRTREFQALVRRHIETSDELVASMKEALRTSNVGALRMSAHSLKSSAAMFGEAEISSDAAEIEQAAKNNSLAGASKVLSRLSDTWQVTRARWEAELADDPSSP
ncbi:MAG: response regulator [bacterium]